MDPGSPGMVVGLSIIANEAFVAMFTIIFIVSIILRDFHRTKTLDTKDQIQVALKVSSFIFTTVVTYNEFTIILQPERYRMSHRSPLLSVVIVYCMCSSTWLVALQCFFYFIKIVSFQWVMIHWVKMKISSIVSWQIVAVEVISLSISLLNFHPYGTEYVSSTNSSDISSTYKSPEEMIIYNYANLFQLIAISPSLVLSIVTTLITTAFLRSHMKKMKDTNTTGELHRYNRAVQELLRYLFLYSVFYVMTFLYYFTFFTLYSIGYWINLIAVFSFVPAVNVLQILGTPRLRMTWKEMTSNFILWRKPNTQ